MRAQDILGLLPQLPRKGTPPWPLPSAGAVGRPAGEGALACPARAAIAGCGFPAGEAATIRFAIVLSAKVTLPPSSASASISAHSWPRRSLSAARRVHSSFIAACRSRPTLEEVDLR